MPRQVIQKLQYHLHHALPDNHRICLTSTICLQHLKYTRNHVRRHGATMLKHHLCRGLNEKIMLCPFQPFAARNIVQNTKVILEWPIR